MRNLSFVCVVAAGVLAAACGDQAPAEDGQGDSFLADEKFDTAGIAEGTVEARGVLALVNAAGRDLLIDEVAIAEKAADAILNVRTGDDGLVGTTDDVAFATLAQLDAVAFVGPKVFGALVDYARAHGFIDNPDGGAPPPETDASPSVKDPCGAFVDLGGDGKNDQAWEYDLSRLPALEEDRLFDLAGDRLVERVTLEYDSAKRLVKWNTVNPDEPENDYFITYKYEDGRLVEQTEATNEGLFRTTRGFSFEANRQPLVQEIERKSGAETVKDRLTFTRDARGRVLTKDTDLKSDGSVDRHMLCTYDDPARTRVCTTTSSTGAVTTLETRVLRSDGSLESLLRNDGRGATVYDQRYTYDSAGRWLTETMRFPGSEPEVTVTTARYQCQPRP